MFRRKYVLDMVTGQMRAKEMLLRFLAQEKCVWNSSANSWGDRDECFNFNCKWGHLAQSVKRQTLDFSSGHDLAVCEFESCTQLCTDSEEPA